MTLNRPFWQHLSTHSEACDDFLALITEAMLQENSLDRINEKIPVDYQRGKVAVLRQLESLARKAAQKRYEEK